MEIRADLINRATGYLEYDDFSKIYDILNIEERIILEKCCRSGKYSNYKFSINLKQKQEEEENKKLSKSADEYFKKHPQASYNNFIFHYNLGLNVFLIFYLSIFVILIGVILWKIAPTILKLIWNIVAFPFEAMTNINITGSSEIIKTHSDVGFVSLFVGIIMSLILFGALINFIKRK